MNEGENGALKTRKDSLGKVDAPSEWSNSEIDGSGCGEMSVQTTRVVGPHAETQGWILASGPESESNSKIDCSGAPYRGFVLRSHEVVG